jgi:hypothetical protein
VCVGRLCVENLKKKKPFCHNSEPRCGATPCRKERKILPAMLKILTKSWLQNFELCMYSSPSFPSAYYESPFRLFFPSESLPLFNVPCRGGGTCKQDRRQCDQIGWDFAIWGKKLSQLLKKVRFNIGTFLVKYLMIFVFLSRNLFIFLFFGTFWLLFRNLFGHTDSSSLARTKAQFFRFEFGSLTTQVPFVLTSD